MTLGHGGQRTCLSSNPTCHWIFSVRKEEKKWKRFGLLKNLKSPSMSENRKRGGFELRLGADQTWTRPSSRASPRPRGGTRIRRRRRVGRRRAPAATRSGCPSRRSGGTSGGTTPAGWCADSGSGSRWCSSWPWPTDRDDLNKVRTKSARAGLAWQPNSNSRLNQETFFV